MQQFFVVLFTDNSHCQIAGKVPGYQSEFALLDPNWPATIKLGHRYLVAVTKRDADRHYFHVRIVAEINELYLEIEKLLLEAKWVREASRYDVPTAKVYHPTVGEIKASFHSRRGRRHLTQHIEVQVRVADFDTPDYSFKIGGSEVNFSLLASHIIKQCGSGQYRHKPVAKSA